LDEKNNNIEIQYNASS